MNDTANPTALRIGMTGTLCGLRYSVAGRVVVGMEEDGETYCWNEFHLLDDSGQSTTLVYEETENGPEWKLFMLFDPVHPLSAAEAARKQVGDTVNLDGTNASVTLVSQSRVYYIEGRAPEGVETGDIANYFNADTGAQMHVVSWTGDEVECYRGMNLSSADITNAFGIATAAPTNDGMAFTGSQPTEAASGSGIAVKAISIGLALLVSLIGYGSCRKPRLTGGAPTKPATRVSPLPAGASGTLAGRSWAITGHAIIEIAKVGARYDWHEYHLRDAIGEPAILICGLTGNAREWHLLRPAQPASPLTPVQAAALRPGDAVTVDGRLLRVSELFQERVLTSDDAPGVGSEAFGFLARAVNEWAMARWTATEIEFYLATPLAEPEVLAAFGVTAKH